MAAPRRKNERGDKLLRALGQGQIAPDFTGAPNAGGYKMGFNTPDAGPQQFNPNQSYAQPNDPTGLAARMQMGQQSPQQQDQPDPAIVAALKGQATNATNAVDPSLQNPQAYVAAAKSRQAASNAGVPLDQLPDMPTWSGPMFSKFKPTSVRGHGDVAPLSPNELAHEADLQLRKKNYIAQQQMGIRPSDRSPEAGAARTLLAALGEQSHSPMQAVNALQGGAPQSTGAFTAMSPKLQAMWAFHNPEAFAAMNQKGNDFSGMADLMKVQLMKDQVNKDPEAVPGETPVDVAKRKATAAFAKGQLPPEHWDYHNDTLDKLVPGAHRHLLASNRKAKAVSNILAQYPHLDKKQLSAWYDSRYGEPWTN